MSSLTPSPDPAGSTTQSGSIEDTAGLTEVRPRMFVQSFWRGNQGFWRTVRFKADGTPDWPPQGTGWSGPLGLDRPGTGDIQATDTLPLANGYGLIQSYWRGNQGFWRTVRFKADGTPDWPPRGTGWSAPLPLDQIGLPGRCDIQTLNTLEYANCNTFVQSIWRGNQCFGRTVRFKADGTPDWPPEGTGWSSPLPLDGTVPGSGDIQAFDSLVFANRSAFLQSVWRGNQGFWRVVPFKADGTPDWPPQGTGWSAPQPLDQGDLPGCGPFQALSTLVYPPAERSLREIIDAGDRADVRDWASCRSIAVINSAVSALDGAYRRRLAELVLDTEGTGSPDDRQRLLDAMQDILAHPALGFYAEIWSYTKILLTGDCLCATCKTVWLSPSSFSGMDRQSRRNVLAHESLHSFNCFNGGPVGALDEGSAIQIFKAAFGGAAQQVCETWAEATYGTKLWYEQCQRQSIALEAPRAPTSKLLDVYQWIADHDQSHLAWNSTQRLQACFLQYWKNLNRCVDWPVWLDQACKASKQMSANPGCKPVQALVSADDARDGEAVQAMSKVDCFELLRPHLKTSA